MGLIEMSDKRKQIIEAIAVLDAGESFQQKKLKELLSPEQYQGFLQSWKGLCEQQKSIDSTDWGLPTEAEAYWKAAKKALPLRGKAQKNSRYEKAASRAEEHANELFSTLTEEEKGMFREVSGEEYQRRGYPPPEHDLPEPNNRQENIRPRHTAMWQSLKAALDELQGMTPGPVNMKAAMARKNSLLKAVRKNRP